MSLLLEGFDIFAQGSPLTFKELNLNQLRPIIYRFTLRNKFPYIALSCAEILLEADLPTIWVYFCMEPLQRNTGTRSNK